MSNDAAGLAIFGVIGLFYLVMILFGLAAMVFWIIALVDACRREFPGQNDKLMWILVIVLTHWIGALVYWFVGRKGGTLPV